MKATKYAKPLLVNRSFRVLVFAYAVAVAIGVAAALATPSRGPGTYLSAANHCTNYFPQYYTPDTNCQTYGHMYDGTWGETPSVALRDSNCINVFNLSYIQASYGESAPSTAYGFGLCLGASSGYQKAGCKLIGPNQTEGRCRTDWHD